MFLDTGKVIGNMRAPAYPSSRPGGWSISASLGFHLLIGLGLLLAVTPRRQIPSSQDSVTVDVLTPQQFEAASRPPVSGTLAQPQPQAGPDPLNDASSKPSAESPMPDFSALPADRPRPEASVMVQAAHLQSAKVLDDPRSAKARKALGAGCSGVGRGARVKGTRIKSWHALVAWR